MDRNVLRAPLSWLSACRIAGTMMSGPCRHEQDQMNPDLFNRNLCYVSNASFGGREVHAWEGSLPLHVVEHDFGSWEGWEEDGLESVLWTSASSDAELFLFWDEQWTLEFRGTPGPTELESRYAIAFAVEVDLGSLVVEATPNLGALRRVLQEGMAGRCLHEQASILRMEAILVEGH